MHRYLRIFNTLLSTSFLPFFLALCLLTEVQAVPSLEEERTVVQPDGATLTVRVKGDEFQNWIEDSLSQRTVLKNQANGFWEYAELDASGKLSPSGLIVDPTGTAVPQHLPPGLKPPRNESLKLYQQKLLQELQQQRQTQATPADTSNTQLASGDWLPTPVSGTRKALVILVNFADRKLVIGTEQWTNTIFQPDPDIKSVHNYYKKNSFGLLNIYPVTHTHPQQMPGVIVVNVPDNHPDTSNPTYEQEATWVNHALADAQKFVNFSALDTNVNGVLDQSEVSIYFILAGYDASGSAKHPSIWAHAWGGTGVTAGGKTLKHWALNGELNDADQQHPMGVIAHELGHSLCGLPDLYDTSYTNAGMGYFSLMSAGSWGNDIGEASGTTPVALDAWSRIYLGWTLPQTAPSDSTYLDYTLANRYTALKLINPAISTSEYFLAENRYPLDWDKGLLGKSAFGANWTGGLLITHIDETVGTKGDNDINKYVAGGHQGVVPMQADTSSCNMLTSSNCSGSAATLFYSGNNATFNDTSTPSNARYYNGIYSNFSVYGPMERKETIVIGVTNPALTKTVMPIRITVPQTSLFPSYTVSWLDPGWNDGVKTGITYELQEATNSAFTTGIRTAYRGTALNTTITGRSKGVTYYYRVRATAPERKPSDWRPGITGCLVGAVCAKPVRIDVPAVSLYASYTIRWDAVATGEAVYELQEATDAAFTTGLRLAYTGSEPLASISDRATTKTYFYRVRATKSGFTPSGWRTASNGCKVKFNASPPQSLIVPANSVDGSYVVTWVASSTTGVTYILEQATDATFTAGRTVVYTGTATGKTFSGRPLGKEFYYRIKATKTGHTPSPWVGAENSIQIGPPCGNPSNLSVPSSDPDGSYTVTWAASATPGVTYTLEEASNGTFTTGLRVVYSGSNLYASIDTRLLGSTYFYRVKATRSGYARSDWATAANGCAITDSYEPDDISSQVKWLYSGTTQSRSFNPANDNDWIKISCNMGDHKEVFTSGGRDTFVDIYNSTGTSWIASYDDMGSDRNFGFSWDCTSASGTLLLKVKEYFGSTGPYTITYRNYTSLSSAAPPLVNAP